ncbi:MAG: hypothetical protein ACSNEK_02555 [Parachlamydiaceae bacterium]
MDVYKQLNEIAYLTGRHYFSEETGFLHLSYRRPEDKAAHSIPILENACFVLALLKVKTQESVQEAKDLLDRLLHFQTPTGNFPVYLHEFPKCQYDFIGADLLLVFSLIGHLFGHVLGDSLKRKLNQASLLLLEFNLVCLKEKGANPLIQLKLAASAKLAGQDAEAKALLDRIDLDQASFWYVPEHLGDALVALQLLHQSIERALKTWHSFLHCYVGPAFKQFYCSRAPEKTFYNLLMAGYTKTLPDEPLAPQPFLLKAALIQPGIDWSSCQTYPCIYESDFQNKHFLCKQEKNYAFSLIQTCEATPPNQKGMHPFSFTWGTPGALRSFVLQSPAIDEITFREEGRQIELYLTLDHPFSGEEREASREICFYTEVDSQTMIRVEGQKSTTFLLDQRVTISHPLMDFHLQFSLEGGEGRFKGHLMRSNRLSQKNIVDQNRFAAHDWALFLRTLQRTDFCRIKATIIYEPKHLEA